MGAGVAGDGDVDEGLVPDVGDGFIVWGWTVGGGGGGVREERAGEDVGEGGAGAGGVVGVEFEEADVARGEGVSAAAMADLFVG